MITIESTSTSLTLNNVSELTILTTKNVKTINFSDRNSVLLDYCKSGEIIELQGVESNESIINEINNMLENKECVNIKGLEEINENERFYISSFEYEKKYNNFFSYTITLEKITGE